MKKTGIKNNKTNNVMTILFKINKNHWLGNNTVKQILMVCLVWIFSILININQEVKGQITFSVTQASCGISDGSITVNVSGGQAPYTYLWSNGAVTQTINNLAVGNYSVVITDANNCTGQKEMFLDNKTDMKITISGGDVTTVVCNDKPNPSITLTANITGGKLPYICSWPGNTLTTNSSGNYSVTVKDSAQCIKEANTFVLFIPVDCAADPNDISGPNGYGSNKMVGVSEKLPYTIRYENNPDFATVPAQIVKIDMPFDTTANMYSLRLGDFGFGDFIFSVPQNTTFYSKRIDVSDSLGVMVDITAGIDIQNKKAFWILESIDPNTGLPPNDANKGFLLVNDSITHRGEGFVNFTMQPKNTVLTGDSIKAEAEIVFDNNQAIKTNVWENIIDAHYPISFVKPLPAIIDTNHIQISFTASDDINGSGIKLLKLFVARNTDPYELYGTYNPDSIVVIDGVEDDTYRFISIAEDNVGNTEPMKDTPDAITTIGYPRLISGTVNYQNNANTPINNVLVYLKNTNGTVLDSLLTNQSGEFNFGYKPKTTYQIDAYSDLPWGGVNSTDALLVRRATIGLSTLNKLQSNAADVNNSKTISSLDALNIRKRMVGVINSFQINDWVFTKDTLVLAQNDVVHNKKALCAGDVNGSFSANFTKSTSINLFNKGEIKVNRNQSIEIPFICENKIQPAAVTLLLNYPDNIIDVEKISSSLPGFMYSAKNGKIIIAWDSLKPFTFSKSDELFIMKFRAKREATEKDAISFKVDDKSEFADENVEIINEVSLSFSNVIINPYLDYELSPNYPNPFSKSTEIRYELPEDGFVSLKAYNILGQEVKTIVSSRQKAGSYSVRFDGSELSGGTYSYKIIVDGASRKFTSSHLMILMPTN
jgi:hypothetical protein